MKCLFYGLENKVMIASNPRAISLTFIALRDKRILVTFNMMWVFVFEIIQGRYEGSWRNLMSAFISAQFPRVRCTLCNSSINGKIGN